jgi:hypothetical protein
MMGGTQLSASVARATVGKQAGGLAWPANGPLRAGLLRGLSCCGLLLLCAGLGCCAAGGVGRK